MLVHKLHAFHSARQLSTGETIGLGFAVRKGRIVSSETSHLAEFLSRLNLRFHYSTEFLLTKTKRCGALMFGVRNIENKDDGGQQLHRRRGGGCTYWGRTSDDPVAGTTTHLCPFRTPAEYWCSPASWWRGWNALRSGTSTGCPDHVPFGVAGETPTSPPGELTQGYP